MWWCLKKQLFLIPYSACIMVACARSLLATRSGNCVCSECSSGPGTNCLCVTMDLLCFLDCFSVSVSLSLSLFGSRAGSRSLPFSIQVNYYLILPVSWCDCDTIMGIELQSWLIAFHLQRSILTNTGNTGYCAVFMAGLKQALMVADSATSWQL